MPAVLEGLAGNSLAFDEWPEPMKLDVSTAFPPAASDEWRSRAVFRTGVAATADLERLNANALKLGKPIHMHAPAEYIWVRIYVPPPPEKDAE